MHAVVIVAVYMMSSLCRIFILLYAIMSYDNDVIIMCLCKHCNDYYTGEHSTSLCSHKRSH